MLKNSGTLFLICETPLHAGSGDALGVVDLPIQRERHTSFPKIEASSLKGALREAFEEQVVSQLKEDKSNLEDVKTLLKKLNIVFGFDDGALKHFSKEALRSLFTEKDKETGKEKEAKTDFAGAIGFTDARLLLFPVKSMKGVFAWITCPKVLKQFAKDKQLTDASFAITGIPDKPADNCCYILSNDNDLRISGDSIVLEEYAFKAEVRNITIGDKSLQEWLADKLFTTGSYWHGKAQKSIVILSDDDFKDFVNLSTEVITRTKINNATGTVQQGALFTEEYLPSESVLYATVLANPEFSDKTDKMKAEQVMDFFKNTLLEVKNIFQLGGNATLGKGIVRSKLLINAKNE